jgi:hypothetical protein
MLLLLLAKGTSISSSLNLAQNVSEGFFGLKKNWAEKKQEDFVREEFMKVFLLKSYTLLFGQVKSRRVKLFHTKKVDKMFC